MQTGLEWRKLTVYGRLIATEIEIGLAQKQLKRVELNLYFMIVKLFVRFVSLQVISSKIEVKIPRKCHSHSAKPSHYENMPIQIYRKFHLQKLNFFR